MSLSHITLKRPPRRPEEWQDGSSVFHSRKADYLLPVWKTVVVQPILDYCSQLWSAQKKGNIQSLDAVQPEFTRCFQETKDLSYWEHLQHLGLYSQQRRRERYYICIYIWKILEKQVPDPTNNTILSKSTPNPMPQQKLKT